jgi:hypothetical protein
VKTGGVVVLSLVGLAGSGRTAVLDEYQGRLHAAGIGTRRSTLFPASVTDSGGLADALGISLGELLTEPTALLVSDAQWADGTSLATLQGVMAEASGGVLVVGSHTEITGYRQLTFQQLTDTATRLGSFEQLSLEPLTTEDVAPVTAAEEVARILVDRSSGLSQDMTDLVEPWISEGTLAWEGGKLVASGPPPEPVDVWDRVSALDRPARKFVEAVSLAAQPVSLPLAGALLDMATDDVLELGEALASDGLLRESAEGFVAVNAATAERVADRMGEVRRARAFGELGDAKTSLGLDDREPAVVGGYYLAAARWDEALRLLSGAGLAAADRQAFGEALPIVQGALQACEASGSDDAALATLEPVWETPFDAGSKVTVAPVGLDGFVYAGTEAGVLWKIEVESGAGEVCYAGGGLPITSDPVISDGIIYIPVRDGLTIDARRAGSCGPAPSVSLTAPVESSPAITGDVLYTGNGRYLEAWDLDTSQTLWRFPGDDVLGGLDGVVRWPVVVAGGIYFTSDDGWLWAVDRQTGEEMWRYNLGAKSVTSPAPGTGVVFVADVSGTLHAIGCADPPECEASR